MRKLVIPAVTAALVIAAMVYQAMTPEAVLCEPPDVRLGEIAGCASEPVGISEAERTILPADTRIDKRIYRDGEGRSFAVTVVVGGKSKSSVHRPELCLPAQGYQMTDPRNVTAGGADWHFVTLARHELSEMTFSYTFFNQAGFRTSSHMSRVFRDVWDRSVLGRIDRWVMVTVLATGADEGAVCAFLAKLKGVLE